MNGKSSSGEIHREATTKKKTTSRYKIEATCVLFYAQPVEQHTAHRMDGILSHEKGAISSWILTMGTSTAHIKGGVCVIGGVHDRNTWCFNFMPCLWNNAPTLPCTVCCYTGNVQFSHGRCVFLKAEKKRRLSAQGFHFFYPTLDETHRPL